jgi:hypothetical protein
VARVRISATVQLPAAAADQPLSMHLLSIATTTYCGSPLILSHDILNWEKTQWKYKLTQRIAERARSRIALSRASTGIAAAFCRSSAASSRCGDCRTLDRSPILRSLVPRAAAGTHHLRLPSISTCGARALDAPAHQFAGSNSAPRARLRE